MDRLSKYILFLFVLISISFFISTTNVYAQSECTGAGGVCRAAKVSCNNGEHSIGQMGCPGVGAGGEKCCVPGNGDGEAFPGISFPCPKVNDPEFHSLRPYQAAVCGDANKALYCSNELKFIESFDLTSKCDRKGRTSDFDCDPGFNVDEHNLYVELTDAMFPIVGNTEEVTNSQGGTEEYDDAQKVNEYASWYLSGVNNRAEYGENTDDRVVNFSGPIQKLLPKMIQEAERIKTIGKATISDKPYVDEDSGETFTEPQNHDQVVVCADKSFLGILGKSIPEPCYEANEFRLSEWTKDLSFLRSVSNLVVTIFENLPDWAKGYVGNQIDEAISVAWNKRFPPLPWDDGTIETIGVNVATDEETVKPRPFENDILYKKAYNEWLGKSCVIVPVFGLVCIDNPGVTNTYADLYQYIPLSSTADKKGAERILDVMFKPSNGTEIAHEKYNEAGKKSAPLYFAHTQEVKELSELLNTTYLPKDYKSKPLPKSTEKNVCSAVNVRANKGDDLFPGDRVKGDTKEMIIPGVTYDITQVLCKVTKKVVRICIPPKSNNCSYKDVYTHHCNAEVAIVVPTDVKVPNADEIFATTVADSGSTFRKIFPKVEEGAPVECIADIPTVTSVTYNADESDTPRGDKITGSLEFKVKKYPEDSAGDNPELTFPHIGSVYEYFLKGIQTALRPQGYGNEQPVSGQTCTNIQCGELPKGLPKASGSCNLGGISSRVGNIPNSLKDIINAAAQTYKVPPNLILGVMFGEGLFNPGRFNWTDQNVKNWATCAKIPNCNETGDDNFMGFNGTVFERTVPKIQKDLQKVDPTRKKFSQCNLMDSIYAIAYNLHDSADGGGGLPPTCFGISLNSTVPTSCSWNDSQYESAIKVSESGYTSACITKEGGCLTGGGLAAACGTGDTCETKDVRYLNPSHNACVWDVAHGN